MSKQSMRILACITLVLCVASCSKPVIMPPVVAQAQYEFERVADGRLVPPPDYADDEVAHQLEEQGSRLIDQHRLIEGKAKVRESIRRRELLFGPNHCSIFGCLKLLNAGDTNEDHMESLRKQVQFFRKWLGEDDPDTIRKIAELIEVSDSILLSHEDRHIAAELVQYVKQHCKPDDFRVPVAETLLEFSQRIDSPGDTDRERVVDILASFKKQKMGEGQSPAKNYLYLGALLDLSAVAQRRCKNSVALEAAQLAAKCGDPIYQVNRTILSLWLNCKLRLAYIHIELMNRSKSAKPILQRVWKEISSLPPGSEAGSKERCEKLMAKVGMKPECP